MKQADEEHEEIIGRLSTDDERVLERCLVFVKEKLQEETLRGQLAMTRGQIGLSVIGVLTVFILPLAQMIVQVETESARTLLLVIFVMAIIFLWKAAMFGIYIIRGLKGYRAIPDFVFEVQNSEYKEAVRNEIALRIWEYRKSLAPTNQRLFWLDRCQRNAAVAIMLLALVGAGLAVADSMQLQVPEWLSWSALLVLGAGAVVWDPVVERFGIWGGGSDRP
jgi:hypothetical protein